MEIIGIIEKKNKIKNKKNIRTSADLYLVDTFLPTIYIKAGKNTSTKNERIEILEASVLFAAIK
jgi:hypothetical protein